MFASAQTSPLPEKRCYCTTHETNCVWISYTQLKCTNLTKLRVLAVTEIGHARCDIIAKTSKRIYTEIKKLFVNSHQRKNNAYYNPNNRIWTKDIKVIEELYL